MSVLSTQRPFSKWDGIKDALITILQTAQATTTKIGTNLLSHPATDNKPGIGPQAQADTPSRRGDKETITTTGSLGIVPLWVFQCEDEIRSKPVVDSGLVFVGAFDNNLYAVKANDGEFFWKYPATDEIASTPFVYNHHVYIGSADNHLYCVKQHNGRLNWRFETGGPIYSSPKAEFDHVFFGRDYAHLYAVNAGTGKLAWKTPVHGAVRSSPCIHDELIIVGTEGGYVFAVDLSGESNGSIKLDAPLYLHLLWRMIWCFLARMMPRFMLWMWPLDGPYGRYARNDRLSRPQLLVGICYLLGLLMAVYMPWISSEVRRSGLLIRMSGGLFTGGLGEIGLFWFNGWFCL